MSLTGLDRTGPIETFVPPIAFAILFELSMDYMVFLTSRIREEHVHGLKTRPAVEHGIAAIGRVVVAAAIIMATVSSAFILTPERVSKEFGLLLAVAILTDALVVKMTLIPAFMTLIGEGPGTSRAGWTSSCRTSRSSPRTAASSRTSDRGARWWKSRPASGRRASTRALLPARQVVRAAEGLEHLVRDDVAACRLEVDAVGDRTLTCPPPGRVRYSA